MGKSEKKGKREKKGEKGIKGKREKRGKKQKREKLNTLIKTNLFDTERKLVVFLKVLKVKISFREKLKLDILYMQMNQFLKSKFDFETLDTNKRIIK